MKIATFAHFKEYRGNHKNFKSLFDFGGRCLKIRDVSMDFEPYFKIHSLVSAHSKSIILGQMTNLNTIFHVVVSVYRFLKTWNSRCYECSGCFKSFCRDLEMAFPPFPVVQADFTEKM